MEILNIPSPSCRKNIVQLKYKWACILNCFHMIIQIHTKGNDRQQLDDYGENWRQLPLWPGQLNTAAFHLLIQNGSGSTKASYSPTSPGPSWALGPKLSMCQ